MSCHRVPLYEDKSFSSRDPPRTASCDNYSQGNTKNGKALPFRKRLPSLLPTGPDVESLEQSGSAGDGSDSSLPQDHGKKLGGGLIDLFRKASQSVKNRQRRHSHAAPLQERVLNESSWRRLRTATSFNKQLRLLSGGPARSPESATEAFLHSVRNEESRLPVPGNGNEPPRIPRHSGGESAKFAARMHNDFELNRQRLSPLDALGDRESGINMALQQADEDGAPASTTSSKISVDFLTRLATEMGLHILSYLDADTLSSVLRVSKTWHELAQEPGLWRQVFLRDQTRSYATGKPIPQGKGLGLPAHKAKDDFKDLYRIRQQLSTNWKNGRCDTFYLNGHGDSIYCVQFDEYV